MTNRETKLMMEQLRRVFDTVRLVDAAVTTQCELNQEGRLVRQDYQCYAVWNKKTRCENCISAKVLATRGKLSKFEFVHHDVYYVIAMYLEVDGEPCVLEMVSRLTDQTLFGAYGKSQFIQSITDYNRKLYVDSLTGAYNRHYFEEQLHALPGSDAMAMLDVDDFKQINDAYGHHAGDLALQLISETLLAHTRGTDAVVRYGGDEFLIIFRAIPKPQFRERLESIREAVTKLAIRERPELRLSVSIGGVYGFADASAAIETADRQLYRAKEKKNCVVCE